MTAFWHTLALRAAISLLFATTLSGCGGSFQEGDDGSSAGGGAGKGSGGAAGGGTCVDGETYFDGCNNCFCDHGTMSCTLIDCSPEGCAYQGTSYAFGESFPAGDGCNTCTCQANGSIGCTEIGCNLCLTIENEYQTAYEMAKTCNPTLSVEQCTHQGFAGLQCGCDTYFNAQNSEAIAKLSELAEEYAVSSCGYDVLCGACAAPSSGYCSAEGRCEDLSYSGAAACKVNGAVYPSGSSGIQDPVSCNTCSCDDGELSCTDLNCPLPCADGSAFGQQCARCGPTDGCEIVEYGCLPTCVDSCADANATCIGGLCRSGVCG